MADKNFHKAPHGLIFSRGRGLMHFFQNYQSMNDVTDEQVAEDPLNTGEKGSENASAILESKRQLAKLALVILCYVFYKNDQQIDAKEHRALEKFMKQETNVLNDADRHELALWSQKKISEQTVVEYIKDKHINPSVFEKADQRVHGEIKKNIRYVRYLYDLRDYMKEHL